MTAQQSLLWWGMGEGTSTSQQHQAHWKLTGVSCQQWQNDKSTGCFYKYLPKSFNGTIKLGIIWDTKMKFLKLNLNTSLKEKTLRKRFLNYFPFPKLNSNKSTGESYLSQLVPLYLWKMPSAHLRNFFISQDCFLSHLAVDVWVDFRFAGHSWVESFVTVKLEGSPRKAVMD